MEYSRLEQDTELNIRRGMPSINKRGSEVEVHPIPTQKKRKIGEITGEEFFVNNIDQGMPLRTHFDSKKLTQKDPNLNYRLDFNLYDEGDENGGNDQNNPNEPSSSSQNYEIDYHDPFNPMSPTYSSLVSDSGKVMPEIYGTDPGSFISKDINKFTLFIFESLQATLNDQFCVTPYGLFNLFGALYVASQGITEEHIYDYFMMISKYNIYEGLVHINTITKKLCQNPNVLSGEDQVLLKHFILVNNQLKPNPRFIEYINSIVNVILVGVDPKKEQQMLNSHIDKLANNTIEPISLSVLTNVSIACVNVGIIRPLWKIPFEKTHEGIFNTFSGQKKISFLTQVSVPHFYTEDDNNQILEMACKDNILSMGFILPKRFVEPEISLEELLQIFKSLRPVLIDEVQIPIFVKKNKIRLSNLLQRSGLRSVFSQILLPDFIQSQVHSFISDVVQNITVIVANSRSDTKNIIKHNNSNSVSNIKFITDHPFIYYFRLVPTNTILLIGQYF